MATDDRFLGVLMFGAGPLGRRRAVAIDLIALVTESFVPRFRRRHGAGMFRVLSFSSH
jgi:hypothetical protein